MISRALLAECAESHKNYGTPVMASVPCLCDSRSCPDCELGFVWDLATDSATFCETCNGSGRVRCG